MLVIAVEDSTPPKQFTTFIYRSPCIISFWQHSRGHLFPVHIWTPFTAVRRLFTWGCDYVCWRTLQVEKGEGAVVGAGFCLQFFSLIFLGSFPPTTTPIFFLSRSILRSFSALVTNDTTTSKAAFGRNGLPHFYSCSSFGKGASQTAWSFFVQKSALRFFAEALLERVKSPCR